jgi:hypothetical protein
LLVDGRTGYRGLGQTGGDRGLKSGASCLRYLNEIGRKRSVGSRKIARHRFDGAGISVRSDQSLGV